MREREKLFFIDRSINGFEEPTNVWLGEMKDGQEKLETRKFRENEKGNGANYPAEKKVTPRLVKRTILLHILLII